MKEFIQPGIEISANFIKPQRKFIIEKQTLLDLSTMQTTRRTSGKGTGNLATKFNTVNSTVYISATRASLYKIPE